MKEIYYFFSQWFHCNSEHQDHKIIHSIKNITPSGSVPQTIAQPYRKQCHCWYTKLCNIFIQMLPSKLIPFFNNCWNWYRIKHVCFKPDTKCNVPSSPEFCCILWKKRLSEILRQRNPKHFATSQNDIHTSGEFHIKLYRICDSSYDDHYPIVILTMPKYFLYEKIQSVCNYYFLE